MRHFSGSTGHRADPANCSVMEQRFIKGGCARDSPLRTRLPESCCLAVAAPGLFRVAWKRTIRESFADGGDIFGSERCAGDIQPPQPAPGREYRHSIVRNPLAVLQ